MTETRLGWEVLCDGRFVTQILKYDVANNNNYYYYSLVTRAFDGGTTMSVRAYVCKETSVL